MADNEMDLDAAKLSTRIVFAGDRDVAVAVLRYLRAQGVAPLGLILPDPHEASHGHQLESLCPQLARERIWRGESFRLPPAIEAMASMDLDYVICVHFPLLIPKAILGIPRFGVLNLHPSLLPFNRGWHTPTWAILDKTPYGATLHFMAEGLDAGDIVLQKTLEIQPDDTADTLYRQVLDLEVRLFEEAWPSLARGDFRRIPQPDSCQTSHKKKDLFSRSVQEIDLGAHVRAGDLVDKLRALTTNRLEEAAYFCVGGHRYKLQVRITKE